ncbi:MAG: DUF1501 domain-containing protein [Gammaproteobacteria bacterium]|nr:DUF1501 domain-containing protein [Gammaproteobacteria bacterium]MDH3375222.1 DUF1501 domain-containing protein [Gammaproteobacteria bacterium]MDH3409308.1 DUF1501 domain-containing protein [Gammaproteobacteria bacterium]MDH3553124.1 DUF1501 domain-containing protein [Gammaproteobacteria bacterium]
MLSRRDILKATGMGAIAASLPAVSFARANTNSRFVLVILRGAADGLAIAAPYGDANYSKLRGELALPSPDNGGGLFKLDGMFGLHPSLSGVFEEYGKERALIVHAVASPYRERSHFDGQDVLENGAANVGALRDGWLNRAIAPLGGSLGSEVAIAMAQNTPLVLRGDHSVTSWAPSRLPDADDSTLRRLEAMYAEDEFFAARLAQALKSQEIAEGQAGLDQTKSRGNDAQQMRTMMQATARFLIAADGPRIAVLEAGGWDTHANQGATTGALANRLSGLDTGLMALRDALGNAWSQTVVAVVTEFGRTAAVNGTRGTDHGTASVALLLGGAVNGGRVVADWPGLDKSDLYQGRDLKPTADIRSLFKAVLSEHLSVADSFLNRTVFPDSGAAAPMRDLLRG